MGVDPVLVLASALLAGALAFVAPLVAGVSAAACLVLLAARGRKWIALASALAFLVSGMRSTKEIESHGRAASSAAVRGVRVARCQVEGVVDASPSHLADAVRMEIRVVDSDCGVENVRILLFVPFAIGDSAARADRVRAIVDLAPPTVFWNPDVGDPRPREARRNVVLSGGALDLVVLARGNTVASWVDRARGHVRHRILATFPAESSRMARALVLGEDDLETDDRQAFRRSGLAHLLAVSGMHLVLVVAGLVAALRMVFVRVPFFPARWDPRRPAALIAAPCAWLYADFAGATGSAKRAAWMTLVALLSCLLGRRPDATRSFAVSIVAMVVIDPLVPYDGSFALSVAATGGLLLLARPIERRLRASALLPAALARPVATSAAASIACAPLLANMTPELPLLGVLANVVAVPLGEVVALPLCLAHGALAFWPAAEVGCASVAGAALGAVRTIAHAAASFPGATIAVPPLSAVELVAFAAFVATRVVPSRATARWLPIVGLGLAESRARQAGAPTNELRITFLDVGQGDAALVDLPDGTAVLVDGGGLVGSPVDVGDRVLGPILRARRRKNVDVVVLSHPHPDHFLGLATGLARVTVGEIWDTGQGRLEGTTGAYAGFRETFHRRGTPILEPSAVCGVRALGGATLEVLAPCPAPNPALGPNDNSFVLRIAYGSRAVLLVGDAEEREEHELLDRHLQRLRADVLKVGHHGSRTSSSPGFLAAVGAEHAVLSCGSRNRFGHPHPATLANLARSGATIRRTDQDGAVTVTTNGHTLDVRTMSTSWDL